MNVTRADVRNSVFTALLAWMVDPSKPLTDGYVQMVCNGLPANFGGQAAAMYVASAGSRRPSDSGSVFGGDSADYRVEVALCVRYAVEDDLTWTQTRAEQILDACEERLAAWVHANPSIADVKNLTYSEMTTTSTLILNGIEYRLEKIYLDARVF